MNYRIEQLDENNVADLKYIYKHAFGKDVETSYLLKKHNTSFVGTSNLGFIAYSEENEPAAFYGVFACEIEFNGQMYLTAQSGDTMTHPNHTRKGLFTKLALHTYEFCKQIGVHLVFGFPNQNSYPGFVKNLSWIHFDDMQSYQIRIKTLPWIRLKNTFKLKQTMHDRFCEKVLRGYKIGSPFKCSSFDLNVPVVNRSSDFFKYKTYGNSFLIELRGIAVWLKTSDMFINIGDIEKCSDELFMSVIDDLRKLAFKMGIPHLKFQCSTDCWLESKVSPVANKMESTYAIAGVNFTNIIPMEHLKFTMADNDTF